jgi:hypothetical protein
VLIKDPSVNSIATFNFTSTVLEEGTTFVFGLWVCIADGAGGFHRHLIDNTKPETPAVNRCNDLDEFVDNLDEMLLPDLAGDIEEQSILNATSTWVALGLLGPDPIRSEGPRT